MSISPLRAFTNQRFISVTHNIPEGHFKISFTFDKNPFVFEKNRSKICKNPSHWKNLVCFFEWVKFPLSIPLFMWGHFRQPWRFKKQITEMLCISGWKQIQIDPLFYDCVEMFLVFNPSEISSFISIYHLKCLYFHHRCPKILAPALMTFALYLPMRARTHPGLTPKTWNIGAKLWNGIMEYCNVK